MGEGGRHQDHVVGAERDRRRVETGIRGEGPVIAHNALGGGGGAGGETQRGEILRSRGIGDVAVGAVFDERRQRMRARGHLLARHQDMLQRGHTLLQGQHGRRRVVVGQRPGADHRPGLAVLEQRFHLAAAIGHVQGGQDAAHHQRAEIGDQELRHVGHLDGDHVLPAQAQIEQRVGEAARRGVQRPIADVLPGGADRHLVRGLRHPALQIVDQRIVVPVARLGEALHRRRVIARRRIQCRHGRRPSSYPVRITYTKSH